MAKSERDVVSVKLDIIFKKFFTENKDMLHEFVAAMLDIPKERISQIIITNPEMPPDSLVGKFSRLDLSLRVDDKLVNVEIQMKNEPDFRDRTLFYWAKLYASELRSGEEYGNLKQTITINIINFNMFSGDDFHTEIAAMIKGTDEVFSDKFSIHFFELKKVSRKPNPNNRRELWLQFINAESREEFDMIGRTNDVVMQKAVNVILDMSEQTRIREMARLREKTLHDEVSALGNARREGQAEGEAIGLKKGKAEGRAEERAAMIAKMRANGMSEEMIKLIVSE